MTNQHTAGSAVAHQRVEAAVDQKERRRKKKKQKKEAKERNLYVQRCCFAVHSKNRDFSFQWYEFIILCGSIRACKKMKSSL